MGEILERRDLTTGKAGGYTDQFNLASATTATMDDDAALDFDPTYNAADAAMAASFSNWTERPQDRLHEREMRSADINGEWSIGSGYGGALTEVNGILYDQNGRPVKGQDDDNDGVNDVVEALQTANERQQEREQAREEWAKTTSTVAGVSMTGAEWKKLAERLGSDEDLRRRLIDAFRTRGMSETEAEARYDRVTKVAEAAAVPPSQRTDDQKKIIADAEADPSFKKDMQTATAAAADLDAPKAGLSSRFDTAATGSKPADIGSTAPVRTITPVASTPGMGF